MLSAKRMGFKILELSHMSFMQIRKSRGPSTDSCGTPRLNVKLTEYLFYLLQIHSTTLQAKNEMK